MQNDGNGNITVGSGSTTTAALKIKGPVGKPDTSFTPDADGNLKISTGNLIIEKGTITAINDFRVTTSDRGTLYLNNDKTNGGHVRFNTGCSGSNVYIDSGDLRIKKNLFFNDNDTNGNQLFSPDNKSINMFSDMVYMSGNLTALNGGFMVNSDLVGGQYAYCDRIKCNKLELNGAGGSITAHGSCVKFPAYVLINGVWNESDYRIKDNVRDINEFTTLFLRPVQYIIKKNNNQAIGLIAHELQEHIPILVNGEKDGKEMQSVDYIGLIPVLIKDIQRLNQKIIDNDAKSESRISNLESRISNLESRISNLESRISNLE